MWLWLPYTEEAEFWPNMVEVHVNDQFKKLHVCTLLSATIVRKRSNLVRDISSIWDSIQVYIYGLIT